ncbi:GntR family transcriptional regulator [Ornithinimicrobium faecis]|uniref:GntR family transcriptional regulator n=1 Tax=Ornithinimicrobium faecis TaxID=2934158 RepID=UPI0021187C1F|nr:GntR family transcriptional regulator [Ornithinimicrobium sp. HY1745]
MPIPATSASVARNLLRDDVYSQLRDAIVNGTFVPGEKLRDLELATWLGVSRTPVREALLRLAQAGLVVTRPGRSTEVAGLDASAVRDAQAVVAAMHQLAVREAVGQLTEGDLKQMRTANEEFAQALRAGNVDDALAADDAFHAVPVRAAANRAVIAVLEQFTPTLRRVERLRFGSLAGRASVALHSQMVELCAAGDAEAAAAVSFDTWCTLEPLLASLAEPRHTEGNKPDPRHDGDSDGPA